MNDSLDFLYKSKMFAELISHSFLQGKFICLEKRKPTCSMSSGHKKSIVEEENVAIQKTSYLLPGIYVMSIFFLWGFSYGLLDILNKHFRNVLHICR